MRWHLRILAGLFLTLAPGVPVIAPLSAQGPAPEGPTRVDVLERVIGEVIAVNPAAKQITLRLDGGGTVLVLLQDKTVYLRVPPGETDLKNAAPIVPSDIGVGDRVYARGRLAEDRKSIPAVAVIMMTKADLAQKRERERADWQKRAVAGTITALKPDTQEMTVSVRSRDGARAVVIERSPSAVFRRYAPDSVQFHQAQPSSFAEQNVGDSVRILGDRNPDGTRIRPEEIVSGSFCSIPGTIDAIDAGSREIRISDLRSKRALTVRTTPATMLRRMPPTKPAAGPGRAAPPSRGQPAPGSGRGTPGASGAGSGTRPPAQAASQAAPSLDVERMPAVKLEELKPGTAVIVLCTVGAEPSRVTAIVLVAGVEPLFTQTPEGPPQIGGAWDFFDIGLP